MTTLNPRPAQPVDPRGGPRGILCPYCGQVSLNPKRCDACGGYFDPLSRQASQNSMGPWFIRSIKSPFRPGCSFETIRDLARKGRITRETVIRGPTTRQFWNFAGRTPAVANLLGLCHNCGSDVSPEAFSCAACGAAFVPETDRQHLGLAPVHLLPGQASPEIIAAASGPPGTGVPAARVVVQKTVTTRAVAAAPVVSVPVAAERRSPWVMWAAGGAAVAFVLASISIAVWREDIRQIIDDLLGRAPPSAPVLRVETPAAASTDAPAPTAPTGEVPAAAPPGPAPTAPPPAETPEPGSDADLDAVRAALAAGGEIDQRALLERLEGVKARRPALSAEVDALAELVKIRAEQQRLRKLP